MGKRGPKPGYRWSAERNKRLSFSLKGRPKSLQARINMSKSAKGRPRPEWLRLKTSLTLKKYYADRPGIRKGRISSARARWLSLLAHEKLGRFRRTKPESRAARILQELGVRYYRQYFPPVFRKGQFSHLWDLYLPEKNILMEIDGCFWHSCPFHFPGGTIDWRRRILIRDFLADLYAEKSGFKVVRVWEHDCTPSHFAELFSEL